MHDTSKTYDTPVLIIGGSLVGLSTALFLAQHGIPCVLIERHAGISPFARASGFNPRTMEMFRTCGLEEIIHETEPRHWRTASIIRVETLAGKELDHYMQSERDSVSPLSPSRASFITQDLLEPLISARAQALGADLRFHSELLSWEQDNDGVSVVVNSHQAHEQYTLRARYLVAADGNRSPIRRRLGIGIHGHGSISQQVFINFKADLSEALRGRNLLFAYVMHPEARGALMVMPDGLRGALGVGYDPEKGEREEDFLGEHGRKLVRIASGLPDVPVEIEGVRSWEMSAFAADRFQEGRVLLAGDSAHVVPPTGGFGANTGIADAYNLAWKLAMVVRGEASPHLLESYDAERRPVADLTVGQAFALMVERMAPHLAAESKVSVIDPNITIFGHIYHSGAVLSRSDENDPYEDPFHPSGRPGTRAPYITQESAGKPTSTLDLFGRNFVLLTGPDGQSWCEAAPKAAASLGLKLDTYCIGRDLNDVNRRFLAAYGLTPTGAVLVRPDGFIAWREAGEGSAQSLRQAFSCLLDLENVSEYPK